MPNWNPTTKQEALDLAKWHKREAQIRIRSMNIGGQRTYDHHMSEAWKWEQKARQLPDEGSEGGDALND